MICNLPVANFNVFTVIHDLASWVGGGTSFHPFFVVPSQLFFLGLHEYFFGSEHQTDTKCDRHLKLSFMYLPIGQYFPKFELHIKFNFEYFEIEYKIK